jgi:hypothetical protein
MTLNISSLGSLLGSNSYNPYSTRLDSSSLYKNDYSSLRSDSNTSRIELARENDRLRQTIARLSEKYEELQTAAENRTGLFGGPVIGANEKGNGGFDVFSGLASFLLPKLLGGGKNKDKEGGGFLGGLFG